MRLCPFLSFLVTSESVRGAYHCRRPGGAWQQHVIAGRHVICLPRGSEAQSHWEYEGDLILICLEDSYLRQFANEKVAALLARETIADARNDAVLWVLADAIRHLCGTPEIAISLVVGEANLLIERLIWNHVVPWNVAQKNGLSDQQQQRMDNFIQANMGIHFKVPQLARAVGLSSQQFTALCRNTTKHSPMKYVWRCRLFRARELARSGKVSRRDIVRLCGFSDVSHLNRRFKRFFRCPLRVFLESANRSK